MGNPEDEAQQRRVPLRLHRQVRGTGTPDLLAPGRGLWHILRPAPLPPPIYRPASRPQDGVQSHGGLHPSPRKGMATALYLLRVLPHRPARAREHLPARPTEGSRLRLRPSHRHAAERKRIPASNRPAEQPPQSPHRRHARPLCEHRLRVQQEGKGAMVHPDECRRQTDAAARGLRTRTHRHDTTPSLAHLRPLRLSLVQESGRAILRLHLKYKERGARPAEPGSHHRRHRPHERPHRQPRPALRPAHGPGHRGHAEPAEEPLE